MNFNPLEKNMRKHLQSVLRRGCIVALASVCACGATPDISNSELPSTHATEQKLTSTNPAIFSGGPTLQPEIISIYLGNFTTQQIADNRAYLQILARYVSGEGAPVEKQPTIWQYGVRGMTVGAEVATTIPNTNLTDNQVRSLIAGFQANGTIPQYGPERLFMVFTKGVTFANPYSTLAATPGPHSAWCSYHASTAPGRWYGLVPLDNSDGCPSGAALTFRTIANAATAPDSALGWYGDGKELASTCNNDVANHLGISISTISDNRAVGSCTIFSPEQLASISPANSLHVAFGHNRNLMLLGPFATGDLGGTFNSPPVTLANVGGAGRIDVFGQGTDNNFYHRAWNGSAWVPAAPNWNAVSPLGTTRFVGQPAVVSMGGQRIDLFAQGINGAYFHTGSDNVWPPQFSGGWHNVGGTFNGPPTVVTRGANKIEIFGRGIDANYYHRFWDGSAPNDTPAFGPWEGPIFPQGGAYVFISEPVVIAASDRYVVFGQLNDNSYVAREWVNGSGWLSIQTLIGNYVSPPAVAYQGTGTSTIDVIGQGTDGCYYHQQRLNNTWGPLIGLDGCGFGKAALLPSSTSTGMFITGTNRGEYFRTITGTSWTAWGGGMGVGLIH